MEPITLGAIAFLTLLGEKVLDKTLDVSIDKAFEKAGNLLKRKSPATAAEIETVVESRALPPGEREDIGEAVLVEKLEAAAQADDTGEIKTALEELAANAETVKEANPDLEKAIKDLIEVVKNQRQTITENWQGINTKGGTVTVNSPQFNFGQK
jgi:hypothetical protein